MLCAVERRFVSSLNILNHESMKKKQIPVNIIAERMPGQFCLISFNGLAFLKKKTVLIDHKHKMMRRI
jgi:hypothetical protein